MACMEHYCKNCNRHNMDNEMYQICPICKSPGVTNWFDEANDEIEHITEDDDE